VTAHASPSADPTAVVGRRIGAWVIDLIIYMVFAAALVAALGGNQSEVQEFSTQTEAEAFCDAWRADNANSDCITFSSGEGYTAYGLGSFVKSAAVWTSHLVLYAVIQGALGGSLGKLAVGLRVVDAQGQRAGIGRSLLRTVLWIADAVTCGLPIIGGVMMVSSKQHRRVGDLAAGTFVVSKEDVGRPIEHPVGYGYGAPATAWGPAAGPGLPSITAPDGPTWDEVRNTYIQYDRNNGRWVQWDDTAKRWDPIEG
jgi:hypothetical protein